ncbi:MAG TPA: hypothetical protein VFX44_05660 [Solirubrobacterales bacterium]|nr:hypothetical protein [Solirubrobacterales bacterium]
MESMREKWTDERLDDLNARVSEGFSRLDEDIREVRSEIAGVRGEMNTRFEATHRLIIQVGGGLFGTMVIGFLSLVLTQH